MVQYACALVLHGKGMRGIIDDLQSIVVGNTLDALDVARLPIAMDRHDGRRLRRDGRFDLVRVHVEGKRINVDKDRLDAIPQQGMGRRHEGIGSGDDLAGDAQRL